MIARWMTVGFVHGVMNTDNMSILGVTIDYGPYGWLEPYEPDWTPNTTDFGYRRYAYGQQPSVALWNLSMLARALAPLVSGNAEDFLPGLETYRDTFESTYFAMMSRKLGLTPLDPDGDRELVDELHRNLSDSEIDMTLFFRKLSAIAPGLLSGGDPEEPALRGLIAETSYKTTEIPEHGTLLEWLQRYLRRLRRETAPPEAIREGMLRANPKYVLRNYLAQKAIDAAEAGDLSYLETLMKVLERPYDEQPEHDELARKRPEWARTKAGCATLSCSS
jgi:uncharacterized protein YdiU (UPF0061 family)